MRTDGTSTVSSIGYWANSEWWLNLELRIGSHRDRIKAYSEWLDCFETRWRALPKVKM